MRCSQCGAQPGAWGARSIGGKTVLGWAVVGWSVCIALIPWAGAAGNGDAVSKHLSDHQQSCGVSDGRLVLASCYSVCLRAQSCQRCPTCNQSGYSPPNSRAQQQSCRRAVPPAPSQQTWSIAALGALLIDLVLLLQLTPVLISYFGYSAVLMLYSALGLLLALVWYIR